MGSPLSDEARAHPATNTAMHAPFALTPYEYPVGAMNHAKELAPLFNQLVDSISRDPEWIVATLHHVGSFFLGDSSSRILIIKLLLFYLTYI